MMARLILGALALGLLALPLGGCGFAPLYAEDGPNSVAGALRGVRIDEVVGPVDAQRHLSDALDARLQGGRGEGGNFTLDISLRETRRAVAASRSADNTRFNYTLRADYTLTNTVSGEVHRSRLDTTVGFGVVDSQYSSLVGREDAVRRAATDLARRIEFDLVLYLSGRKTSDGMVDLPEEVQSDLGDDIRYDDGNR